MVFLGRKVRIKLKHLTVFKLVLHECAWSNNQLMELQQYYLISRVCHNSTVLYKKKNIVTALFFCATISVSHIAVDDFWPLLLYVASVHSGLQVFINAKLSICVANLPP